MHYARCACACVCLCRVQDFEFVCLRVREQNKGWLIDKLSVRFEPYLKNFIYF